MGIITGDKGNLMDAATITWDENEKRGNILWKVPRNVHLNDNVVVREDEIAVFYRDGKALGCLNRPDRYALTSMNAPLVGEIVQRLSGVQQQAEVYYLPSILIDGKYGSKEPYYFEDKMFDKNIMVQISVFGKFRYKVLDPMVFINHFVGTYNLYKSAEVEDRIKDMVVMNLFTALGKMKEKGMRVVNIPANQKIIEQLAMESGKTEFEKIGIELDQIFETYFNIPKEMQDQINARSSFELFGPENWTTYKTTEAMVDAAKNPSSGGGAMGAGIGVGAGVGMGYMMMNQMAQVGQKAAPQPGATAAGAAAGTAAQQPPAAGAPCTKCGAGVPSGSKFCPACGATQQAACPKCGAGMPPGAKFCPACGASLNTACAKCGTKLEPGAKFCPNCGNPVA